MQEYDNAERHNEDSKKPLPNQNEFYQKVLNTALPEENKFQESTEKFENFEKITSSDHLQIYKNQKNTSEKEGEEEKLDLKESNKNKEDLFAKEVQIKQLSNEEISKNNSKEKEKDNFKEDRIEIDPIRNDPYKLDHHLVDSLKHDLDSYRPDRRSDPINSEIPKLGPVKLDPLRLNPVKLDPFKFDPPVQLEALKGDPLIIDQVQENQIKLNTVQVNHLKEVQVALPQTDIIHHPQVDLPKTDILQVDLPKIDKVQVDLHKIDIPQVDLPKVDLPKAEIPKADIPQVDLGKVDIPQIDHSRVDGPKVDLPPVEISKVIDLPKVDLENVDHANGQNNENKLNNIKQEENKEIEAIFNKKKEEENKMAEEKKKEEEKNLYNEMKLQEIGKLIQTMKFLMDKESLNNLSEELLKYYMKLLEAKTKVLFIGPMSSGKTSLINLILSYDQESNSFCKDYLDFFQPKEGTQFAWIIQQGPKNQTTISFDDKEILYHDKDYLDIKAQIKVINEVEKKTKPNQKEVNIKLPLESLKNIVLIDCPALKMDNLTLLKDKFYKEMCYIVCCKDINWAIIEENFVSLLRRYEGDFPRKISWIYSHKDDYLYPKIEEIADYILKNKIDKENANEEEIRKKISQEKEKGIDNFRNILKDKLGRFVNIECFGCLDSKTLLNETKTEVEKEKAEKEYKSIILELLSCIKQHPSRKIDYFIDNMQIVWRKYTQHLDLKKSKMTSFINQLSLKNQANDIMKSLETDDFNNLFTNISDINKLKTINPVLLSNLEQEILKFSKTDDPKYYEKAGKDLISYLKENVKQMFKAKIDEYYNILETNYEGLKVPNRDIDFEDGFEVGNIPQRSLSKFGRLFWALCSFFLSFSGLNLLYLKYLNDKLFSFPVLSMKLYHVYRSIGSFSGFCMFLYGLYFYRKCVNERKKDRICFFKWVNDQSNVMRETFLNKTKQKLEDINTAMRFKASLPDSKIEEINQAVMKLQKSFRE